MVWSLIFTSFQNAYKKQRNGWGLDNDLALNFQYLKLFRSEIFFLAAYLHTKWILKNPEWQVFFLPHFICALSMMKQFGQQYNEFKDILLFCCGIRKETEMAEKASRIFSKNTFPFSINKKFYCFFFFAALQFPLLIHHYIQVKTDANL